MKRSSRALVALAPRRLPRAGRPSPTKRRSARTSPSALPDFPKIDEVTKTAIPGIYELRIGTDILYTDEHGNYLIEGQLIDTKTRTNLTEQRISKLTAIDFKTPAAEGRDRLEAGHRRAKAGRLRRSELRLLQEVRARPAGGQGRHRLHLPLSDPRRRLAREVEADLVRQGQHQGLARLDDQGHARSTDSPDCDASVLQRNFAFGQKHRINGTPGLVFEDGSQQRRRARRRAGREAARRQPRQAAGLSAASGARHRAYIR